MTAHLDQLDALAASLPPGAVLAHVVTTPGPGYRVGGGLAKRHPWPAWAKIGDEPWRSVRSVATRPDNSLPPGHYRDWLLEITYAPPASHPVGVSYAFDPAVWRIVTPSVTWEQDYGLRGRHEVMGVVG